MRLILLILLLPSVAALGVVPSSQEVPYSSTITTHKLEILNPQGGETQVLLYTEGELSQYIELSQSVIDFVEGETEHAVFITFNQPEQYPYQGRHEARIIAREIPAEGQIAASISVISKLILVVPYEGTYAEMRLFISSFEQAKQDNFVAEVTNLGTNDITSGQVFITIRETRSGNEIQQLTSEPQRIAKKTKAYFTLPWTPDIPQGAYTATATLIYDGNTLEDQKVFSIGRQSINIESISVQNFQLGGIAKFDILLKNQWSDSIGDIYAQVDIRQQENLYDTSTTQTIDLGSLESRIVNAYWDTEKVVPGSYDLYIKLFYNGQVAEHTFPITVTQNQITTGVTGQVISAESAELNPIYLLILLVVIVVVLNVLLLRKLKNRTSP